ncbi:MAG: photosystem II protein PsbQ [cyanobacterium endosymbiont of Rhopalodia musculus]
MDGPLSALSQQMNNLHYSLLHKEQKTASNLMKKFFKNFEQINVTDMNRDRLAAENEYYQAVCDFNTFLYLIPKCS